MNDDLKQLVATQRELAEAITRQAFAIEALATTIQQQQEFDRTPQDMSVPADMSTRHAGL